MREWIVSTLGGGAAALAIIVAVIGLAGAFGGAAVSYFVAQKTVYINSITTERMKWITSLRANIAKLLAELVSVRTHLINPAVVTPDTLYTTFKVMSETAKALELQLNTSGFVDRNILVILAALYKSTSRENCHRIDELSAALVDHSRWLLKAEWERVKHEAMGPLRRLFHWFKMKDYDWNYRRFAESDKRIAEARLLADPKPAQQVVPRQ